MMKQPFATSNRILSIDDLLSDNLSVESGAYSIPLNETLKTSVLVNNDDEAVVAFYYNKGLLDIDYSEIRKKLNVGTRPLLNLLDYQPELSNKVPTSREIYSKIIDYALLNRTFFKELILKKDLSDDNDVIKKYLRMYVDAIYHPTIEKSYTMNILQRLGIDADEYKDKKMTSILSTDITLESNASVFNTKFKRYVLFYLLAKYVNEPHYINSCCPDLHKTKNDKLMHKYKGIRAYSIIDNALIPYSVTDIMNQMIDRNMVNYSNDYLHEIWTPVRITRTVTNLTQTIGTLYNKQHEYWSTIKWDCDMVLSRRLPGFVKIGHRYGIPGNRYIPQTDAGSGYPVYLNYTAPTYEVSGFTDNGDPIVVTDPNEFKDSTPRGIYTKSNIAENMYKDKEYKLIFNEWFNDNSIPYFFHGMKMYSKMPITIHNPIMNDTILNDSEYSNYNLEGSVSYDRTYGVHSTGTSYNNDLITRTVEYWYINYKTTRLLGAYSLAYKSILDRKEYTGSKIKSVAPDILFSTADKNKYKGELTYEFVDIINQLTPIDFMRDKPQYAYMNNIYNKMLKPDPTNENMVYWWSKRYMNPDIKPIMDEHISSVRDVFAEDHMNLKLLPTSGLPEHLKVVYGFNERQTYHGKGDNEEPNENKDNRWFRPYIAAAKDHVLLKDMHPILAYTVRDYSFQDKDADSEQSEDDSDNKWEYFDAMRRYGLPAPNSLPHLGSYANIHAGILRLIWKKYRRFKRESVWDKRYSVHVFPPESTIADLTEIENKNNKYFFDHADRDTVWKDPDKDGRIETYEPDDEASKRQWGEGRTEPQRFKVDETVVYRDWGHCNMMYHNMTAMAMPVLPPNIIDDLLYLCQLFQSKYMEAWLTPNNRNRYLAELDEIDRLHSNAYVQTKIGTLSNNLALSKIFKNKDLIDVYHGGAKSVQFTAIPKTNNNSKISKILLYRVNKKNPETFDSYLLKHITDKAIPNVSYDITSYDKILPNLDKHVLTENYLGDKYVVRSAVYKSPEDTTNTGFLVCYCDGNVVCVDKKKKTAYKIYTNKDTATEDNAGLLTRDNIASIIADITKEDVYSIINNFSLTLNKLNQTITKSDYKNLLHREDINNLFFSGDITTDILRDKLEEPEIVFDNSSIVSYSKDKMFIGNGRDPIYIATNRIYSVLNNVSSDQYVVNTVSPGAIGLLENDLLKNLRSNKWKLLNIPIYTGNIINTTDFDHTRCVSTKLWFRADNENIDPDEVTYEYNYVELQDSVLNKLPERTKAVFNEHDMKPMIRSYVLNNPEFKTTINNAKEIKVELFINDILTETLLFSREDIALGRISYFNMSAAYGKVNFLAFGIETFNTSDINVKSYAIVKNKNITIDNESYNYDFKIYWR